MPVCGFLRHLPGGVSASDSADEAMWGSPLRRKPARLLNGERPYAPHVLNIYPGGTVDWYRQPPLLPERNQRPAMEQWIARWVTRARALKTDVVAVGLAYRDPRTQWYARLVAVCVVAYALSPIDLIPDPIPVLGYVEDLVLLPLGLALAVRLIPHDVLAECRVQARMVAAQAKPTNWIAAGVIIAVWVLTVAIVMWWLLGWWNAR